MIIYYGFGFDLNVQIKNIFYDIEKNIDMLSSKQKLLARCLKNIKQKSGYTNQKEFFKLNDIYSGLYELVKNISSLENLKYSLNDISSELSGEVKFDNGKLVNLIEEYNKNATACKEQLYSNLVNIENLFLEYTEFFSTVSITPPEAIDSTQEENISDITDSNVLLISEIQNKVVLPYTVSDLEKTLSKTSKYSNLQEVIDSKYTFPLSQYKNARTARFKEAYNLMRNRENSSLKDSLDLALELSFNRLLNPAIIAACKNLDELDIYLDCLNSNELNKFNLFEIKYEILPKLKK